MARRDETGDPLSSRDRNLLRAAESYGRRATAEEISRMLGLPRREVSSAAETLTAAGLLLAGGLGALRAYVVTAAGRAELAAHVTSYLLVEVDDRMAEDVEAILSRDFNGIVSVSGHGGGCCCQHCPHRGNCR